MKSTSLAKTSKQSDQATNLTTNRLDHSKSSERFQTLTTNCHYHNQCRSTPFFIFRFWNQHHHGHSSIRLQCSKTKKNTRSRRSSITEEKDKRQNT